MIFRGIGIGIENVSLAATGGFMSKKNKLTTYRTTGIGRVEGDMVCNSTSHVWEDVWNWVQLVLTW